MGLGQPSLRSGDSEGIGRVMEPRKDRVADADAFKTAEGFISALHGLGAEGPPGSESRAWVPEDPPGTWEALVSPPDNCGKGNPVTNSPGLPRVRVAVVGANDQAHGWYGHARQRAWRDGHRGVGASHTY